jgi:hypothetical protein
MQSIMKSKTEHLLECFMQSCRTPVIRESFLLRRNLLLVLLSGIIVTTLLGSLGLLPPDTTGTAAAEWRGQSEVNVLLGVEADHEGGDVDDLLADTVVLLAGHTRLGVRGDIPDVALADEDTGVVDGLGKTELVDAGLEAALQEVLDLQGQDVIEPHAGLVEHTDTDETANERVTLEQALGVLLVKSQERTAAVSDRVSAADFCSVSQRNGRTHRAARRILDRVNCTRHTSRLLRSPYSPTSLSSVSLTGH